MALAMLRSAALFTAAIATAIAVLAALSVHSSAQGYALELDNLTPKLGEGGYDIEPLVTPALSGLPLQLFAAVMTSSPAIVRILLNGNGVHKLRALSMQVPKSIPPVMMPMVRLPSAAYAIHVAAAASGNETDDAAAFAAHPRARPSAGAPAFWSVEDYAAAYRSGATDPIATMRRVFAAIDATRERLGRPFVETRREDALRDAAASAARFAAGAPLGVFDGVPIAVKDEIDVKGYRSAHGTVGASYGVFNASDDDEAVARFRRVGAIIVGKTVMTEWGTSPIGYNAHAPYKGPFNAYNTSFVSGGSSSGSATAVAAGIVPVAIGFDGGGSIRIPAAVSGIFGIAATYGRVPFGDPSGHSGVVSSMIKCGPLAATARDTALAMRVMAAPPAPTHAYAMLHGGDGPPPFHLDGFFNPNPFAGLRIGIFKEWNADADPEAVVAVDAAVAFMAQRGAVLVPITIPNLSVLALAHSIGIASEFGRSSESTWHLKKPHHYAAPTAVSLAIARAWSGIEVHAAQRVRGWTMHLFRTSIFAKQSEGGLGIDVIATPTVGTATPPITEAMRSHGLSDTTLTVQFMKYIFLANLCGLPAIAVPVAYSSDSSLPISLHLMGSWWEEAMLLSTANAIEEKFVVNKRRRPASWTDVLS